jgi:hypothetical protein
MYPQRKLEFLLRAAALHIHTPNTTYLHTARSLVLVAAALAQQRVHLVDEDHGGLLVGRHREQSTYCLLALANPFAHQGRRADAEEGRAALVCDGFPYQGFPCHIAQPTIKQLIHAHIL